MAISNQSIRDREFARFVDTTNDETAVRVVGNDGLTYNFMEQMAQMGLFNPLYIPVLSVTSIKNNTTDMQMEFWHDGFLQYYMSYDTTRDESFVIVENNILKISTCTVLALDNGDYLELE